LPLAAAVPMLPPSGVEGLFRCTRGQGGKGLFS
jgi:hypothetical protein